ncbi:MAG: hypothetical protein QNJ75_09625 [Acidimicrobiia bacterium]|nr:hypothetical protein [Acidimicrobiia bacterium]
MMNATDGGNSAVAAIRKQLDGIAGVADLDVDLREDGLPRLRVYLDGTVPSADVGEEIRLRLAAMDAEEAPSNGRRTGLGRGLPDILAADAGAEPPRHLQAPSPAPTPVTAPKLALVAVEETAGGISVRAADSTGGLAFSPVEDQRSLNQAVVSAVGRLRHERPLPRLAGVEIREVSGATVLTVVLDRADGSRAVGAALVEGGMPFTLGTAVWEALSD